MLTSELLRVRHRRGAVVPAYLRGGDAERMLPVARDLMAVLSRMTGCCRDDVEAALESVEVPVKDRTVALGLRKVLEGRCEYAVAEGVDPEGIRHALFHAAAAAHRALHVRAEFDRNQVMREVSAGLKMTPEAVEAALYADLRGNEILTRFDPLSPEWLIRRYNLALAQSVLLRAVQVTIRLRGESPLRCRAIFRALRFHGLIHVVQGDPTAGYTITVDGPFSLFDAVQRYGMRLAMFLPSLLSCASFRLVADVLWGKSRAHAVFELSARDGLVSLGAEPEGVSPEIEAFRGAFERLSSEWKVAENEHIFALPGEVVCVPDLVFTSSETGEEVYLEAFGFWSRDAVFRRVELIRKGFPARILLAVSKKLRVSEELLGEEDAGEVYVYKSTMSPRAVLDRLRQAR